MLKQSHFLGESEHGLGAVPLFGPADSAFEKIAAPSLRPEVVRYIENLRPSPTSQYVLVNAMGAGEFYGSNINGDHFPEAALIHRPDDWKGVPVYDMVSAKNWPYGFPTFYGAHPFAHHRNKNPGRAFGEVELATWNPLMRRVELVVRCDKDKCYQFGGVGVWDKLKMGQYPDVSMGTKVPFDTCSICLDWELFRQGLQMFDPKRHRHPGMAVLELHKKLKAKGGKGIRGLSVTRKDYCEHARREMNRILPDGRKVFVRNDFPRFFDISFVFIGADKTAKVMLFIFSGGKVHRVKPSAEVADDMGYSEKSSGEKTASIEDAVLKHAFQWKDAKDKSSAIKKNVVPSQFAGKAVPILTAREPDLPREMQNILSRVPMENALSTLAGMGMVLRPREFQRITLMQLDCKPLADDLEKKNIVFPRTEKSDPMKMGPEFFMPALARLLLPMMADRSGLGPIIERRVVAVSGRKKKERTSPSSHPSELLSKIAGAYNGYRSGVMNLVANTQSLLNRAAASDDVELHKIAAAPADEVFTPLSAAYFSNAFLDEVPVGDTQLGVIQPQLSGGHAGVERGHPSVNTWSNNN